MTATDTADLSLVQVEHAAELHSGFKPHACAECWPGGAPAPRAMATPSSPSSPPSPPKPRERGDGWEPIGAGLRRYVARVVVDQADPPPPDPNVAADGGPVCQTCHSTRWLRRELDRYDPQLGRAIECPDCLGWRQQQRLERFLGSLPELYRSLTLETYPTRDPAQQRTLSVVREWLADRDGGELGAAWLYLCGRAGRGKTGLAIAAARELGLASTYTSVPRLLVKIASTYDRQTRQRDEVREVELLGSLGSVAVLVLDEFGAEAPTAWAEQRLYQVIDERAGDPRLVTIVASNRAPSDLGAHLAKVDPLNGERVISRLFGRCGPYVVQAGGPDLRMRAYVRAGMSVVEVDP